MSTPVLKKYYLQFDNPNVIGYIPKSIELYIFPEDFTSSLIPRYSKLNDFGIYPHINIRSHDIAVRYGNRYLINKIEEMALESLETGIPLTFGSSIDYAIKHSANTSIPNPDLILNGNETVAELIALEKMKKEEIDDYEFELDTQFVPYQGFIELPIVTQGLIGSGNSLTGFSFKVVEVKDLFRTVQVGDLTFKLPPENYSYNEVSIIGSSIEYGSDGTAIVTPGFIRKGFNITLPNCSTDVLETLKVYKNNAFVDNPSNIGVDVLDNIGNSFNGKGQVSSLTYSGAINDGYVPNGLSFTILSIQLFKTS